MKIKAKVKPNSKESKINIKEDMFGNKVYEIRVKSPPKEGKANKEMLEILSNYFDVPKSHIKIKSGLTSRNKVIIIPKV